MQLMDMVRAMPPIEQAAALKALDACTRPLTVREIEHALRRSGLCQARAVKVASSLRKIAIVAVTLEGGK